MAGLDRSRRSAVIRKTVQFAVMNKGRLAFYPLTIVVVGILAFIIEVARFDAEKGLDESNDAGVVFFGGFGIDDRPNDESRKRLSEALSFLAAGRFDSLVVVGGKRKRLVRTGAQMLADEASREGLATELIYVADSSYDSLSNLKEVAMLAESQGWKNLLFVSSPLHVVRLAWLKEREGIEAQCGYYGGDLMNYCMRWDISLRCWHEWLGYASVVLVPDRLRNRIVVILRG